MSKKSQATCNTRTDSDIAEHYNISDPQTSFKVHTCHSYAEKDTISISTATDFEHFEIADGYIHT